MPQNNYPLALLHDSVWLDKYKYDDAERHYYETKAKEVCVPEELCTSSLVKEIANARKRIQNSLKEASKFDLEKIPSGESQQIQQLRADLNSLKSLVSDVQKQLSAALCRISALETSKPAPTKVEAVKSEQTDTKASGDDDDDIDLFGSDEDDDAAKLREERLKAYDTKKAKKAPVTAKSSVILDVKPWDDETDMKLMEEKVREIESKGLVWGASKLVPLAYGIKKLQIVAIVEDEHVSIDWLQETIQEIEDYVQSVDIAAFNKL